MLQRSPINTLKVRAKSQKVKVKTKFRFLPDIATADLAFEAKGRDYNELFENAGLALESAQVDLETIQPSLVKKIKLESYSIKDLLFSFLEELIFIKDSERILFNRIECKVERIKDKKWKLECKLSGERIDIQKHKLGVDVKAVTKHLFRVEGLKTPPLRCLVVVDV